MSVMETLEFHPMLITDVFDSMKPAGKWFDLAKAIRVGELIAPYVTRSGGSNGIGAFLPHQGYEAPNPGNAITIGVSTSTVFYQPVDFYTSKEIQVLRHSRLTATNAPILISILREQMGKFQWGNGASIARLRATRIMVPATVNSEGIVEVDWDGMDQLGTELHGRVCSQGQKVRRLAVEGEESLPSLKFKPMLITDIFDSMKASNAWYDRVHLKAGSGKNLYLSQTQGNNSVVDVVADQDKECEPGNCITVTLKTQATFYQPVSFYTAQNFLIFRHELMNEYNGLFLTTAMRQAMDKFSWGYGVSMARLKKTRIMVPVIVEPSGEEKVDWDGMTAYGRALRARAEQSLNLALGDSAEPQ